MFLSRRVNWYALLDFLIVFQISYIPVQRALPSMMMILYATKTMFHLLLPPIPVLNYGVTTPDNMEAAGFVSASN
jgi:hypothetical protein